MADRRRRLLDARISRRRVLRGAAAAGAAAGAMALVGCSGEGSTPASPTSLPSRPDQPDILNPSSPPRHGGRLVTANAASFGTFDPHLGVAVASAYYPRLYNVLVNQSATKPEFMFMDLAQSFETPDEQTIIFKLRPGVKVGPNDLGVRERDLDGEDVRVTLERIKATPTATNFSFARDHLESITVSGDTVTIRTPEPYAWFMNRIGHFFNAITPRELMEGDVSRLTAGAAGAGPYRLLSVSEGDIATFARNPNYYRKDQANNNAQLPYIDELEVRVIFERSTQRVAFESNQVHQFMTGSGEEARSLSNAVIARDPFFAYIGFTMNPDRAPFTDPLVRRAVSRAINRQQFVDLVYHGDAQANGLVQWSLGAYALPPEELQKYQPYDLEEARRLVKEVGGITLKMMYPANTPVLEHSQHLPIFVEQMRAAGIDVAEDPQEFTTWLTNLREVNYDCTLHLNQQYETPETPLGIHTERGPFGDGTYLRGLDDAEIQAAVDRVGRTMDVTERIEAVHEAQRIIYEKDPVSLPLVTPYQYLVWRDSVKNIPSGIGTSSYLINTLWMDA